MTEFILLTALASFDAFTILSVYGRTLAKRASMVWIWISALFFIITSVTARLIAVNEIAIAVISAILCVVLSLPYQAKWKQRILYAAILISLDITAEIIAGFAVSSAIDLSIAEIATQAQVPGTAILIGSVLAKLIFFFLARLVCRAHAAKERNVPLTHWLIIVLVPATSIIIQYGLAIASTRFVLIDYSAPFLILFGMLAINILAFAGYDVMSDQTAHLLALERRENRMRYELKHYEMISDHSKRLSRQAHDIRSHMIAIQGLITENRNADALNYIRDIAMPEYVGKPSFVPSYPDINAVIGDRIALAEKSGIRVSYDISIPTDLPVKSADICIILGNALDNAIEACNRANSLREREIRINIFYEEQKLIICIVNTSDPVKISGDKCRTTKADHMLHGFGLENIRSVVDSMGGNMIIRYESEGLFILNIVLFIFP